MQTKNFIAYYRVSTEEQGQSGLGLKAQRESVHSFVKNNGILLDEFQDVESGAKSFREGLNAAIRACKETGSTLIVKDLSRISRGGFKIMVELEEAGVKFIESTSPYDNQMIKEIKFSLAKDEREKISERTKSALSMISKKVANGEKHISKNGNVITSLGSPENLTPEARAKGVETRKRLALENPDNRRAYGLIKILRKQKKSFYFITAELNSNGFKTSTGKEFNQMQTKRIYEMFNKNN